MLRTRTDPTPLRHATTDETYNDVALPEILHARAPHAVYRHLWRTVLRILVLVAADLVTLEVLRIILSAARDRAWFGARVAELLASIVPAGAVPALPLQAAVLLGLTICGGYVGGARKRHIRSVALGAMLGALLIDKIGIVSTLALASFGYYILARLSAFKEVDGL